MEQSYKFPIKINSLKHTHKIELAKSFPLKRIASNPKQTIPISNLNLNNLGLYTMLPIKPKADSNLKKYINSLSNLYDNLENYCDSKQKFQQYLIDNKQLLSCKLNPLAKIFLESQKLEMDKILESFNFYKKLHKTKVKNDVEALKKITKEFFNIQCMKLNVNLEKNEDIKIEFMDNPEDCGEFNCYTSTLLFKINKETTPEKIINTMFHEFTHIRQYIQIAKYLNNINPSLANEMWLENKYNENNSFLYSILKNNKGITLLNENEKALFMLRLYGNSQTDYLEDVGSGPYIENVDYENLNVEIEANAIGDYCEMLLKEKYIINQT